MKQCNIRLKVNDKYIELGSIDPNSNVTIKEIVSHLRNDKDLREQIVEASAKKRFIPLTEEDLTDGIQANTTLDDLLTQLNIHKDHIDKSTKILAVNRFKVNGSSILGKRVRTPKEDGTFEDVYVINPNNEEQVGRLINYLELKYKLEHIDQFPNVGDLLSSQDEIMNSIQSLQDQSNARQEALEGKQEAEDALTKAKQEKDQFVAEYKDQLEAYNDALKQVKEGKKEFQDANLEEYNQYTKNKELKKDKDRYSALNDEEKKKLNAQIKDFENKQAEYIKEAKDIVDTSKEWKKDYDTELEKLKNKVKETKDKVAELKALEDSGIPNLEGSLAAIIYDYMSNRKAYSGLQITYNGKLQLLSKTFDSIIDAIQKEKSMKEYESISYILSTQCQKKDNKSKQNYLSLEAVKTQLPIILDRINNKDTKSEQDEAFIKAYSDTTDLFKTITGKNKDEKIEKQQEAQMQFLNDLIAITEGDYFVELGDFDSSGKKIWLKYASDKSNQAKYGWDFDTIKGFQKENDEYRGYKIFKGVEGGKTFWVITNNIITPYGMNTRFDSLEKAQLAIDNKIKYNPLYEETKLAFILGNAQFSGENGEFKSVLYNASEGTVLAVPDITLTAEDVRSFPNNIQKYLFSGASFDMIQMDYNKWAEENGVSINWGNVTTPEKMLQFLINLGRTKSDSIGINEIQQAIDDVSNITHSFYQIQNSIWTPERSRYQKIQRKGNQHTYEQAIFKRVLGIKIKGIDIEENKDYKPDIDTNIKAGMEYVSKVFGTKLGVVTTLKTADDIAKEIGPEEAKQKAFIYNGQVIINVSCASIQDQLHEYSHLLLGILKTQNYNNYMALVKAVAERRNQTFMQMFEKYPELAQTDIMEETFVEEFSKYIMNANSGNLEQTLNEFADNLFGKNKQTLRSINSLKQKLATTQADLDALNQEDEQNAQKVESLKNQIERLNLRLAEEKFKQIFFGNDTNQDISSLLKKPIATIFSTFGSNVGDYIASRNEFKISSEQMTYRKISNKIKELLAIGREVKAKKTTEEITSEDETKVQEYLSEQCE